MRVVGIIQARTGSTRLRNKVIMKLGNKTILEILLNRLTASGALDRIVVATTTEKEDDIIENIVLSGGFEVFRGSEEDVLDRYYNAAKKYKADIIVRITADNPLTDIDLLDAQTKTLVSEKYDYISPKDAILGLGCETFKFDALEKAWNNAREQYQREHVTPYIYENPEVFNIGHVNIPDFLKRNDIRLTIDTIEDFKLFQEIYNHFGDLINISIRDIIKFLDEKSHIKKINIFVKQKNYKEEH